VFVDCTGDGRLGLEAGASFMEGREDRRAFGESLARAEADRHRLGSTLLLQARRHDRPMPFVPPRWARKFTEHDLRLRPHASNVSDLGLDYGYWWVEWGGTLDTVKDDEAIRDELLAVVLGVWDHVKNGGDHGADHWALDWVGFLPGKRESRRFAGRHVLCESDVLESRRFDDAIAYGGWFIDTHPPEGVDAPEEPPCRQHEVPYLYDIPLRCCLSREVDNLMFAGRNISATHLAFASTRVMGTCAAVGQGVGTAAAHAKRLGLAPAELPGNPDALRAVQQQLLRDDAYLIGRTGHDPADLARRATVRASSERPEGGAAEALSGQTRCVHGDRGATPDRAAPGTHRWMSDPRAPLPAWIELRWPSAVAARQVQIVFDTGLHRVLTFSLAEAYTAKMLWGRAQPETVRDYRVEVERGGRWGAVAEVRGNHQRLRRHDLDGEPFDAVRVSVAATNGLDHARICELRVLAADPRTHRAH